MKKIILLPLLALLLATSAPAFAQPVDAAPAAVAVPDEPGEAVELAGDLLSAAKSGQWTLVFVLAIVLLVYVARMVAGKWPKLRWLNTKWGGWCLVLAGTAAGTVATALAAGQGVSWSLISSALTIGLAAAGAHELHGDSGLKGA